MTYEYIPTQHFTINSVQLKIFDFLVQITNDLGIVKAVVNLLSLSIRPELVYSSLNQ